MWWGRQRWHRYLVYGDYTETMPTPKVICVGVRIQVFEKNNLREPFIENYFFVALWGKWKISQKRKISNLHKNCNSKIRLVGVVILSDSLQLVVRQPYQIFRISDFFIFSELSFSTAICKIFYPHKNLHIKIRTKAYES